MNVANITAEAISQGLTRGFQSWPAELLCDGLGIFVREISQQDSRERRRALCTVAFHEVQRRQWRFALRSRNGRYGEHRIPLTSYLQMVRIRDPGFENTSFS